MSLAICSRHSVWAWTSEMTVLSTTSMSSLQLLTILSQIFCSGPYNDLEPLLILIYCNLYIFMHSFHQQIYTHFKYINIKVPNTQFAFKSNFRESIFLILFFCHPQCHAWLIPTGINVVALSFQQFLYRTEGEPSLSL